jgi:hypothetical protein
MQANTPDSGRIAATQRTEGFGPFAVDGVALNMTLLPPRTGGVERVVHSIFLFLDLDPGRAADADQRDATGKLGQRR